MNKVLIMKCSTQHRRPAIMQAIMQCAVGTGRLAGPII